MENKQKIVIYGGSFNPPCLHHRQIAEELRKYFDKVIVYPCGVRADKTSTKLILCAHRKEMIKINFSGLEKVEIDFYDLDNNIFTPTYNLDLRLKEKFSDAEIWHAIGEDIVQGENRGTSQMHHWYKAKYVWKKLNFVVLERHGYYTDFYDMPLNSTFIPLKNIIGSSRLVRSLIKSGKPINDFVLPEVKEYIKKNNLYS